MSRDGLIPVYAQVGDLLKARIREGVYPEGKKLPGIKVLAKELGVNHLTVRQALRTLEEGGLVATESARGTFVISTGRTHLRIALVLPNLYESSSAVSAGAHAEMRESRSTVDIFHYNEDTKLESEYFNRLASEGYDGAIVFPSLDARSLKPLLRMVIEGFPLVFIDRAPADVPCWTAWADNLQGGYLATRHLIERGCRRIACETSELHGASERFEGYLRAMAEAHLPIDYQLVRKFVLRDEEVELWVDECMGLPELPDAFFFANDFQAMRGIRRLLLRGKRVPDDVRVIGFDGLSIGTLSYPSLSTVKQDFHGLGQKAAALLREQVQLPREKRFSARHENISVELVVRDSS